MSRKPAHGNPGQSSEDLELVKLLDEESRFAPFGEWMDSELQKFVDHWKHLAAPNAERASRLARR